MASIVFVKSAETLRAKSHNSNLEKVVYYKGGILWLRKAFIAKNVIEQ